MPTQIAREARLEAAIKECGAVATIDKLYQLYSSAYLYHIFSHRTESDLALLEAREAHPTPSQTVVDGEDKS